MQNNEVKVKRRYKGWAVQNNTSNQGTKRAQPNFTINFKFKTMPTNEIGKTRQARLKRPRKKEKDGERTTARRGGNLRVTMKGIG